MGFAVFVVGSGNDFLKYAEVGSIAGFGNAVVCYRLLYGAAGLADMAAVAVFAESRYASYLSILEEVIAGTDDKYRKAH